MLWDKNYRVQQKPLLTLFVLWKVLKRGFYQGSEDLT